MRVLLPPSESKRPDGGTAVFRPESLPFQESLGAARERVRDALDALSTDAERAARILKLGVKSERELRHNTQLSGARELPAIERYVGVLYDEIDLPGLDTDAVDWITEHVLIQSALFGLVQAGTGIPPYRLSASTKLTDELGITLTRLWASTFASFPWPDTFFLDLRSKDYAALAPLPRDRPWVALDIVQRGEDGELRALNHFNKRAKGDLVKRLAQSRPRIADTHDLLAWGAHHGIELHPTDDPHAMRLVASVGTVAGRERVA